MADCPVEMRASSPCANPSAARAIDSVMLSGPASICAESVVRRSPIAAPSLGGRNFQWLLVRQHDNTTIVFRGELSDGEKR